MKKLVAVLALICYCSSCGSSGGSAPQTQSPALISVSISPTTVTVQAGGTEQFNATVSNTTNTAVTWQVNNVTGGNSTVGTISSSGLFTAPSQVPSPSTVTVTAVSQADTSKSASTSVTISAPISVSIQCPGSCDVPAGASLQLTPTVQNATNTGITWQVNGDVGGNSTVGTISSSGLYTAPPLPPQWAVVTIAAVSQADASVSASVTVGIEFSNASLTGQYAFAISGYYLDGIPFSMAGSLQADGNGNITGGLSQNGLLASGPSTLSFAGNYQVNIYGQAQASIGGFGNSATFDFVLDGSGSAFIIDWDGMRLGTGLMTKQNPSAFSLASLSGGWAFSLTGSGSAGEAITDAGRFSLDTSGNITSGLEDYDDGGTITPNTPFTGSASTVSAGSGAGTLSASSSLGSSQFAYYVVSENEVVLVSFDPSSAISGVALKQQATSFSASDLKGDYVFFRIGSSPLGTVADAGLVSLDGSGNLSNGIFDENDSGLVTEDATLTGSYTVSATSRGTATVQSAAGIFDFVIYMVSSKEAIFTGADPAGIVASGYLKLQSGAPFSNSSLVGPQSPRGTGSRYALLTGGSTSAGGFVSSGWLAANEPGFLNGSEDLHEGSATTQAVQLVGTSSLASNGRGTATINVGGTPWNFAFYVIDKSEVVFIGTDPNEIQFGLTAKQF